MVIGFSYLSKNSRENSFGAAPEIGCESGVFSASGIQTGPFASLSTPFALKNFHLFHFYTGRPILITPEG